MNNYEEAMIDRVLEFEAKVKELEVENHKLKLTMQLHAGDCCSLNNEVELFRDNWEDAERNCGLAEEKCKELQAKLELAMSQNYCTVCGNILDGYIPPKGKK